MSALDSALDDAHRRELTRAARALLRRPLLSASGADAESFRLVRQHASELRDWFDVNTGWRLHVDSEVARLGKRLAAHDDATHPAREPRSRAAFGRRRYVLTCLALAVLERADAQITLGRLAEGVIAGANDERLGAAGVTFRLEGREERGDLVAVVRLLLDLGVLARVAGDEDAFVRDAGDVLYDVDRHVLAVLFVAGRGPSMISEPEFAGRIERLVAEPIPTADELRNRVLRHRLTRRLLDDPVVYYTDLEPDELAYLTSQRSALIKRVADLTQLVAEVRAEGIAMVDPRDELTDVRMPEVGTDGHVALLISEYLAARDRCPEDELHALVRRLAVEHRAFWRRNTHDPGAEVALVDHALDRLEALRLVHRTDGVVHTLPALARFSLAEPTFPDELSEAGEAA